MAEYITMPMYGFGITEGKVARWNIVESNSFEAGQGIAEIETDKLTNSMEAPMSATLLKILVDGDMANLQLSLCCQ